jgi:Peptidase family M50
MRLWPSRSARAATALAADLPVPDERLSQTIEDVLAVRERRIGPGVAVFRGALRMAPERALALLVERWRPLGWVPLLHEEFDAVVVRASPAEAAAPRWRVRWNVLLFVLTCLTMLLSGVRVFGSPTFDAFRDSPSPFIWMLSGVPFAGTLLAILIVHEFGHYVTARHYRAAVSLPYFIPAPPFLFPAGTLGAIIQMRSPARDRNSLFDIAAAGPLAGLAVALPAAVLGVAWSALAPAMSGVQVFGDSVLMRVLFTVRFGEVPAGMMIFTHPMADAAWFGFLVTAINLLPAGQLDGGRIAFALFGRRHATIGRLTVAGLVLVGLVVTGIKVAAGYDLTLAILAGLNWFVWAALIRFLVGYRHGPVLDSVTPLTPGRRIVGALCFLLLVLLLPPVLVATD